VQSELETRSSLTPKGVSTPKEMRCSDIVAIPFLGGG